MPASGEAFHTEALAGAAVMMVHGLLPTKQEHIDRMLARMQVYDAEFSGEHLHRLVIISAEIVDCMRHNGWLISDADELLILNGALLHDIGKLWIPHRILHKPAKLTPLEKRYMQLHPLIGWWMLLIRGLPQEARIALYHHEWVNGTGYLFKKKGGTIPLGALIASIADAIDAMGNDRPYQRRWTRGYILSELYKGSGTQFDDRIVDALLRSPKSLHRIFNWLAIPHDPVVPRRGSLLRHAQRLAA